MAHPPTFESPAEPSPIEIMFKPFQDFFATSSASGIVLFLAAVVAIVWANSPESALYHALWEIPLGVSIGTATIEKHLIHWVNDGLMAIFFFLIGLEIKREILVGELASVRSAALPIAAAIGGMVVPALLFAGLNFGHPGENGWGIPMATDIAFALGVLALLGDRCPSGLKVFLAALAIVDDLGAILVIALFYTANLSTSYLLLAGIVLVGLMILNRLGVRSPFAYAVLGAILWFFTLKSGIHATIAGVLSAATIPARSRLDGKQFVSFNQNLIRHFDHTIDTDQNETPDVPTPRQHAIVQALSQSCDDAGAPLFRLEHRLHPWVAFFIMPFFALVNGGLSLDADALQHLLGPIPLGIILGLVLGKQVGITAFSWIAVRSGIAQLPDGVTWRHVYGIACLGGIGFTMSLFIGGLAYDAAPLLLEQAKLGILVASILSGTLGFAVLARGR